MMVNSVYFVKSILLTFLLDLSKTLHNDSIFNSAILGQLYLVNDS